MSKPIVEVEITSVDNNKSIVRAVFDTGSFYTIIRQDKLPSTKFFYPLEKVFKTAAKGGKLKISGVTVLYIKHEGQKIDTQVLVSKQLSSEMLIGAKTMQSWDINIINEKGATKVVFTKDMHDPEITEVD